MIFVTISGSKFFSQLLDNSKVETETSRLSDSGRSLPSLKSFDSMFLEDLDGCIHRARIYFIGLASLDLDSDSRMLNSTLNIKTYTTKSEVSNPVWKAANVLSIN